MAITIVTAICVETTPTGGPIIRDIRRDEAKIAHDRWELRRDLERGNYRAAAHEREELRREYRDINRDRADVYRDTRDIRRDERERYWYGR